MKIWKILLLVIPFCIQVAEASNPRVLAETFLVSVKNGNVSAAYDKLFIGSSIPRDKPQAVTMLKQQTTTGLPLYGKILGHELIHEEKFGVSITRLVYILKSEKHPTTWEFFFYKPGEQWILSNILFNDQFSLLSKKN